MAQAVRIVANPADTDERHTLYDSGRIVASGGAAPVAVQKYPENIGSDTAPTFFHVPQPWGPPLFSDVRAIQVIDWATPSGYVVDWAGYVHNFGGADEVAGQDPLINYNYLGATDIAMDPAGNGEGYVLYANGRIAAIGGAAAVPWFTYSISNAIRLQMEYATKEFFVLGGWGFIYAHNGAGASSAAGYAVHQSSLWPNWERARSFQVIDFDTGAGWLLDQFGNVYAISGADDAPGFTVFGSDRARDLFVIDDGSGADPLELLVVDAFGAQFSWVVSTPPTVTALTPVDPVEDTTRPTISWSYSDPEGDAQRSYEVAVFTAAQYGVGGFDPATSAATWRTSGTSNTVTAVTPDVDLENDTYRAYVRASDTSDQWSDWDSIEWDQDVAPPSTPTVTATDEGGLDGISLAINVASVDPAWRIAVEYHDDDWDGWTWLALRDASELDPDGSGDTAATDYDARVGVERTYRAAAYTADPLLVGSWSADEPATLTGDQYAWYLTAPADPSLGMVLRIEADPADFEREVRSSTFFPVAMADPAVITDGAPRTPRATVVAFTLGRPELLQVRALTEHAAALLLRNPDGDGWYVRLGGNITETRITADDYDHRVQIPLVSVARPVVSSTVTA